MLRRQCATCIFRRGIREALGHVAERANSRGTFVVCHDTIRRRDVEPAVCRGFYNHHPDNPAIQVITRLWGFSDVDPPESRGPAVNDQPDTHPPPGEVELLTVHEVAALFRVKPKTVNEWARNGRIKSIKVSRERRFRRDDINALLSGEAPRDETSEATTTAKAV